MPNAEDIVEALRAHGIQPSAQRVAVAEYVLRTPEHPSAERVFTVVGRRFPMLSRATVYNTLNLFVEKGLLRELVLAEGKSVFDPKLDPHHHFIDEKTGSIDDVPWDALQVSNVGQLSDYEVREYQVVLRGRRRKRAPSPSPTPATSEPTTPTDRTQR
jgi:Fur family iron response transcriptional regulator